MSTFYYLSLFREHYLLFGIAIIFMHLRYFIHFNEHNLLLRFKIIKNYVSIISAAINCSNYASMCKGIRQTANMFSFLTINKITICLETDRSASLNYKERIKLV